MLGAVGGIPTTVLPLYQLNPVRANMVNDPADYFWSSYGANALGKASSLITPHPEYLRLGRYPKQRRERYRALFAAHLDDGRAAEFTAATDRGLALGSAHFRAEIERQYQRRVTPGKVGRPRLNTGEGKQCAM